MKILGLIPLLIAVALCSINETDLEALQKTDVGRSFKPLVRNAGFRVEEHQLMTEDKYWLKVF